MASCTACVIVREFNEYLEYEYRIYIAATLKAHSAIFSLVWWSIGVTCQMDGSMRPRPPSFQVVSKVASSGFPVCLGLDASLQRCWKLSIPHQLCYAAPPCGLLSELDCMPPSRRNRQLALSARCSIVREHSYRSCAPAFSCGECTATDRRSRKSARYPRSLEILLSAPPVVATSAQLGNGATGARKNSLLMNSLSP
jgi:hypothetical protein